MNYKKNKHNPFQRWGEKINWDKRIKSVCKPCWELKYCPYGPLVEQFPIDINPNDRSCRIFGHDCPVFSVSEPFTETKELRNISRSIPRSVQFRVLKRENQICSECGNSVKDEYIEFDHIIPWSKGGSSDENNIRLLCKKCNRKRGKKFEEKYLINSVSDHLREPIPYSFLDVFIEVTKLVSEFKDKNNQILTAQDFCKIFGLRKVREADNFYANLYNDFYSFFNSKKPNNLKTNEFNALKFRWGLIDNKFHKLKEVSTLYNLDMNCLFQIEYDFFNRLGFYFKINDKEKLSWLKK